MHVLIKMVFILAVLFVLGNSACSGRASNDDGGSHDLKITVECQKVIIE